MTQQTPAQQKQKKRRDFIRDNKEQLPPIEDIATHFDVTTDTVEGDFRDLGIPLSKAGREVKPTGRRAAVPGARGTVDAAQAVAAAGALSGRSPQQVALTHADALMEDLRTRLNQQRNQARDEFLRSLPVRWPDGRERLLTVSNGLMQHARALEAEAADLVREIENPSVARPGITQPVPGHLRAQHSTFDVYAKVLEYNIDDYDDENFGPELALNDLHYACGTDKTPDSHSVTLNKLLSARNGPLAVETHLADLPFAERMKTLEHGFGLPVLPDPTQHPEYTDVSLSNAKLLADQGLTNQTVLDYFNHLSAVPPANLHAAGARTDLLYHLLDDGELTEVWEVWRRDGDSAGQPPQRAFRRISDVSAATDTRAMALAIGCLPEHLTDIKYSDSEYKSVRYNQSVGLFLKDGRRRDDPTWTVISNIRDDIGNRSPAAVGDLYQVRRQS